MALVKKRKEYPGKRLVDAINKRLGKIKLPKGKIARIVLGAVAVGATVVVLSGVAAAIYAGVGAFLAGGLVIKLGVLATFTALFFGFVAASTFIYSFNWNISDKELRDSVKSRVESLYSLFGQAVGTSLGYLVGGGIPGMLAFAINPTVAAAILVDLNQEVRDEVVGELTQISYGCFGTLIYALTAQAFTSARKWIKRPGTPLYKVFASAIGEENLQKWGNPGSESFQFSEKVEKKIENIQDSRLKNFTQEFYDSFGEAMVDAGFIVTNSIDEYIAAQKLMKKGLLGEEKKVKVEVEQFE